MCSEKGAGRRAGFRAESERGRRFVRERVRRALGHTLIALIVAGGFGKLAYIEIVEALRRGSSKFERGRRRPPAEPAA